MRTNYIQIS